MHGIPSDQQFEEFFARHSPAVWRLCLSILQSEDDAADAFQNAWVRFFRKARGRPEALAHPGAAALLLRFASREAGTLRSRRWRQAKRELPGALPTLTTPDGSPAAALAEREAAAKVLHCLDGLPERYALPIRLHYLAGLKHREIAEVLGVSVNTVSTRLARGTDRLRTRLQRAGIRGPESMLLTAAGLLAASVPPAVSAAKVSTLAAAAGSGAFLASLSGATAMKLGLGGAAAVTAAAIGIAVLTPDENPATAESSGPEPVAATQQAGSSPPASAASGNLPGRLEARFLAPEDTTPGVTARELHQRLRTDGMAAFPAPTVDDVQPFVAEFTGNWPVQGRLEGFEPLGLEHFPPSPGSIERSQAAPHGIVERVQTQVDGNPAETRRTIHGAVSGRMIRESGTVTQTVEVDMPHLVIMPNGRQLIGRWRNHASAAIPGDSAALPFVIVAGGEVSRGITAIGGDFTGGAGPEPAAWGTVSVYTNGGTVGPLSSFEFPLYEGMTLDGFTGSQQPFITEFYTQEGGVQRRRSIQSTSASGMSVALEPSENVAGSWALRVVFDYTDTNPRPGGSPPVVRQRDSVTWEDTLTITTGRRTLRARPGDIRSEVARPGPTQPPGSPEERHYELRITVE